jgi:hypothetical protein
VTSLQHGIRLTEESKQHYEREHEEHLGELIGDDWVSDWLLDMNIMLIRGGDLERQGRRRLSDSELQALVEFWG